MPSKDRPSALPQLEQIPFDLHAPFEPAGDQVNAIPALREGIKSGAEFQTLLGVTGSGKTYTMANVIAAVNRPTLVIAPNKTLAAQLYGEFREFFPKNRVSYFVSYYDYYQPEAYIPTTDTYIEKDASTNEEIDMMRHSATRSILESTDTIVVASVSCIYGLGAPEEYFNMMLFLERGEEVERDSVIEKLLFMQYERTDGDFARGSFRVRGDTIDVFPSDERERAIRLSFFGEELEEIRYIDSLSGATIQLVERAAIYPVSHFVTARSHVERAMKTIRAELDAWLPVLRREGRGLEAQRLEQRTMYDLELLQEIGFCSGIENYSRHLTDRAPGEPPKTLIDYFPDDFLLIIDESHVTIPQLGGMYNGDQARKRTLVEYGFRLPSALDNRPLNIEEFWNRVGQTVFVSATPGDRELEWSAARVIEQINRPTGLLDPEVEVRPAGNQVDDLLEEIRRTTELGDRVLVTTLTKKMAEDLSVYLREAGVSCRYLHADINTIERSELLRGLRRGDFDVLIGINLLREGLDLVEVSLVAILDADKEGFLRSTKSLIQTMGRAARNIRGRVILYGDKMTRSMAEAIQEADRRREIQDRYNKENGITPRSASRDIHGSLSNITEESFSAPEGSFEIPASTSERKALIEKLRKEMFEHASKKAFEEAARLRDLIKSIEHAEVFGE